jgi:hypothetical protein
MALRAKNRLVAQGRIQAIVDRIFPLEDVELAFAALRQGNSRSVMSSP